MISARSNFGHLDRFINAIEYPPAIYEFRAVAVISSDLVDGELSGVSVPEKDQCTLVVISVPDLKVNYSNGPTEGVNTKIKLLKRRTYGRASFRLLRKRILLTD